MGGKGSRGLSILDSIVTVILIPKLDCTVFLCVYLHFQLSSVGVKTGVECLLDQVVHNL